MRASRTSTIAVALLFGGLIGSRRLEAQAAPETRERGCRGDETAISVAMPFGTLVAFPVITVVPPSTPAALAGLQVGDSILTVAGQDSRERPKGRPFFAPGDTLALTVRREKVDIPIAIVFGRTRQEGTGSAATRVCRPVSPDTTPRR